MPANSPGITSFTLRVGVDEFLYSNITGTGAQATFGVPPQMGVYRGIVIFQVVGIGAAPTTVTGNIEVSLIPESTVQGVALPSAFGIFNKQVLVGAGPATYSSYSAIPFVVAGASTPIAVDLSGLGGNGKFRLNLSTNTLGGASGINVYAHIG